MEWAIGAFFFIAFIFGKKIEAIHADILFIREKIDPPRRDHDRFD